LFFCASETLAAKNQGGAYYTDRLWLPISYQQHFPRLLEAAEKVSVNEYCNQLLDGTLYEEQSSANTVMFRFRCRTTERRLFTIRVDAKTLTLTNSLAGWIKQQAIEKEKLRQEELEKERLRQEAELEKERLQQEEERLKQEEELEKERVRLEEERLRIEAELRKEIEEREQYWGVCNKVFTRKANLFNSAKVISKMPPQPDISDDGEYTYYIEFQTLSSRKTVLNYVATARISSLDKCDVDIRSI
jgi:flagellar motility protein MotE (MotC chaperone)